MSLEDEIAAILASNAKAGESEKDSSQTFRQIPKPQSVALPTEKGIDAKDENLQGRLAAFHEKWSGIAEGRVAINLLTSPYEDDFSGMIQSDSPRQIDNLVEDIYGILLAQNKVTCKRVMGLNDLFMNVSKASKFRLSGDENLPAKTLIVLNRIKEFEPENHNKTGKADARFMIDRLSHIVDDRYVIITGNSDSLSFFLSQDRKLRYLFEEHTIVVQEEDTQSSLNDAFESFMKCISPDLASLVDENFRKRFDLYVARNERDLPYQGTELGDYLAKQCNASGELVLPKGRSFESAQDALDKLIGLGSVKRTMRDIAKYAVTYDRDRKNGLNPPKEKFHMVFSGPPGTGKTTVGKIAAEILYEAGVIPSSNQLTVSADELIDPAIGRTAIKTREVIEKARGGVLFIDEAYSLIGPQNSNVHGSDAIAQLLLAMENFDDLVIIFGGYRDEMAQLTKSNPGFKSRISFNLDFDAFTPQELIEIINKLARDSKFNIDEAAIGAIMELITFFSPQRGFGNARFMRQVFHKAYINRAVRLVDGDFAQRGKYNLILAEDIPTITQMLDYERDEKARTSEEEVSSLVGLEDIKKKVHEFRKTVHYRGIAREQGLKNPKQTLHMVFTGNPGTGKTTVARIIAKILFECGVTATPHYKEASAQDLVGEYVGHTGAKTKEVLENALGGVLFIDEAYSISYNSSYGQDAIAEIVKFMEDYRDQIVIIFAGYTQEINEFLALNPGLASRIGFHFEFKDYDTDELQEIFKMKIDELGYRCADGFLDKTRNVFRYFHSVENFGNGRFVDKVLQSVISLHAENLGASPIDLLTPDDVPSNEEMCKLISLPVHEPLDETAENTRRIAIHEMGHAVCGLELLGKTGIKLITIEEEATGTLGFVEYEKDAFPALPTRENLVNRIAMCMGGMAAEEMFMGDYSAGNTNDLEQATSLAASLVTRYGMSPQAGYISYPLSRNKGSNAPDVSKLPEEVRLAIQAVISDSLDRAKEVLAKNKVKHSELTEMLVSAKTISGEYIVEIWNGFSEEK